MLLQLISWEFDEDIDFPQIFYYLRKNCLPYIRDYFFVPFGAAPLLYLKTDGYQNDLWQRIVPPLNFITIEKWGIDFQNYIKFSVFPIVVPKFGWQVLSYINKSLKWPDLGMDQKVLIHFFTFLLERWNLGNLLKKNHRSMKI